MKNHIGRTLLVLILFIHSLTSLASSQSKYTPLIRQVRGWPSEKILSKGDQFLQNKKEDKALVMYMLVCSRTNDRMTDEELTDCSLANLKVGDIFYARGNYINALENYQEGLKLSETRASDGEERQPRASQPQHRGRHQDKADSPSPYIKSQRRKAHDFLGECAL